MNMQRTTRANDESRGDNMYLSIFKLNRTKILFHSTSKGNSFVTIYNCNFTIFFFFFLIQLTIFKAQL